MGNIVTLNGQEISLISIGKTNHLTDAQRALLELMHDCVKKNKPLDWSKMVLFYSSNVKSAFITRQNTFKKNANGHWVYEEVEKDIVAIYKKQSYEWSGYIRPSIRQWFATNIGSMVLKGSILALPVIEID